MDLGVERIFNSPQQPSSASRKRQRQPACEACSRGPSGSGSCRISPPPQLKLKTSFKHQGCGLILHGCCRSCNCSSCTCCITVKKGMVVRLTSCDGTELLGVVRCIDRGRIHLQEVQETLPFIRATPAGAPACKEQLLHNVAGRPPPPTPPPPTPPPPTPTPLRPLKPK